VIVERRAMRVGTTIATSKDITVVTPQVQTASSSHRNLIPQSHHTAYERLLAVGLGVAMAAVATVALLLPTDTTVDPAAGSTQTVAQGKATPRTTAGSISAADTTSVE
jgi:pyruvate/2-oxoacid:ferredoxin oxidoreductase beta subunit